MSPIFAQNSTNTMLAAIIFTVISLPLGAAIGYLWAYRFKRKYLTAAKELANLQGHNFRGELSTVGIPQGVASHHGPVPRASRAAERQEKEIADLTVQRDQLAAQLTESHARAVRLQQQSDANGDNPPVSEPESTAIQGMDAWQLKQLHREQIATQLKMDEYVEQIASLTAGQEQWQAQAERTAHDVERLRGLLAQHEATIASVERQRDSFGARVHELEQHVQEPS